MIVARYNKENHKITLISIPRDTRVEIPGYGFDKINSAAARKEGTALAMETVGNQLGIPIHHYVKVSFKGAASIVDILGGVEVNVPMNMDYEDPAQDLYIHLKKGTQVLNGKDAVKFARFRHGYPDQDLGRIKAQQNLIKAFIDKLTSPSVIPKALNIVDAMSKCIKTNMESSDIANYAIHVKDLKMENITFYTLPGDVGSKNKISYYLCDEVKLKEMMEQMQIDLGVAPVVDKTEEVQGAVPVDRTKIKLQILNGTRTSGLAGKLKEELAGKGYTDITIGDADSRSYEETTVIDRSGDGAKLDTVLLDSEISKKDSDIDFTCGYDITIIIGKDRVNGGM
jgi:LCP family protein required for cell wall assembly